MMSPFLEKVEGIPSIPRCDGILSRYVKNPENGMTIVVTYKEEPGQ